MAKILEGKSCARKIEEQIKKEVQLLGIKPGLAAIIVGNNPASKIYVSRKIAACTECGFFTKTIELSDNCSEQKLLTVIQELNADEKIHGILLQLPLPKHLNEQHIIEKIDINKDVDGFHPLNRGLLVLGKPVFTACTPKGILELLNFYNITIAGKNVVIVGRSITVGKPLASLLLNADATVTICHSKTKSLAEHTKKADILVVATGRVNTITPDMITRKTIVIDVGINRINGKITGDVSDEAKQKSAAYTPVPGGIGPMTIAMLLQNTLLAAKRNDE
ncbi:bifunctional 5,10-methylenetetrahydrofolate dehydrogenase/5,10-methenyltetrahydrofolate cyclohydrolase [Candidatus Woesearchaeota archaeon]|nr:bifunctional 5,10-methylenetetrahydrofolate dehydrogenase/5,10-methenyltetrahydrofolate cyclohydrolase [Candidatus Woesearchaeota archaeon]